MIFQKEIKLSPFPRGFLSLNTSVKNCPNERNVEYIYEHTSASLTLNENADPTVGQDFETFNVMVPESANYFLHTLEGPRPLMLKAVWAVMSIFQY